jgi:hypothetical protein
MAIYMYWDLLCAGIGEGKSFCSGSLGRRAIFPELSRWVVAIASICDGCGDLPSTDKGRIKLVPQVAI